MISLIFMREIKSFFRSPMGYIVTGLFCLMVGWMFMHQLNYFITSVQKVPVHMRSHYDFTNEVIIKLFSNVNFLFLFITPILGMKIFSEEYKEGTIDLYFSAPVSDLEIIIGKFLALLTQGFFLLLMTGIFPFALGNLEITDISFLFTGYLGLFFNFSCFAVLSLFASSLSPNQMISALGGFVLIMGVWILGWFGQGTSNYLVAQILNFFSVNYHFSQLLKGVISLSDIVFYFSFIIFGILLTKIKLASRFW